jgi:hypothetical protein
VGAAEPGASTPPKLGGPTAAFNNFVISQIVLHRNGGGVDTGRDASSAGKIRALAIMAFWPRIWPKIHDPRSEHGDWQSPGSRGQAIEEGLGVA